MYARYEHVAIVTPVHASSDPLPMPCLRPSLGFTSKWTHSRSWGEIDFEFLNFLLFLEIHISVLLGLRAASWFLVLFLLILIKIHCHGHG